MDNDWEIPNNDAVDIDSSKLVWVTGCYLSSWDDGMCIKTNLRAPLSPSRLGTLKCQHKCILASGACRSMLPAMPWPALSSQSRWTYGGDWGLQPACLRRTSLWRTPPFTRAHLPSRCSPPLLLFPSPCACLPEAAGAASRPWTMLTHAHCLARRLTVDSTAAKQPTE